MWLWFFAAIVAYFIKGLCGFANTLVFTSILAFGTTNINISPVELFLGYPSNLILTWKHRKELDKKVFIPLAILVLAGCIPGALLLKNVDPGIIKIIFGIVIILLGIDLLLRESGRVKVEGSKPLLTIIGIMSGILCGLFGVGALLAGYMSRVTDNSSEFKANISAVFIVENTFRVILYSVLGIITFQGIKQALILVPFMLIGLFARMKSAEIMDDRIVKKLVIILLIISGAVMVAMSIGKYI